MTPRSLQDLMDVHAELTSPSPAASAPKPSADPALDLAQLASMKVG